MVFFYLSVFVRLNETLIVPVPPVGSFHHIKLIIFWNENSWCLELKLSRLGLEESLSVVDAESLTVQRLL